MYLPGTHGLTGLINPAPWQIVGGEPLTGARLNLLTQALGGGSGDTVVIRPAKGAWASKIRGYKKTKNNIAPKITARPAA